MILEAILSSLNEDETPNFAPIGVRTEEGGVYPLTEFEIHLYPGSHTYENLKRTGEGVVNFSDDLMAFVDSALYSKPLAPVPSEKLLTPRMAQVQAFWEFTVREFDDTREPARLRGQIIHAQYRGNFSGFCRAHGAILEALIAATRLQWLTPEELRGQWPHWQEIVIKTGGSKERSALAKIKSYLQERKFMVAEQPE